MIGRMIAPPAQMTLPCRPKFRFLRFQMTVNIWGAALTTAHYLCDQRFRETGFDYSRRRQAERGVTIDSSIASQAAQTTARLLQTKNSRWVRDSFSNGLPSLPYQSMLLRLAFTF
jgi:hypothetical protein